MTNKIPIIILLLIINWNSSFCQDANHYDKYGLFYNHNCEMKYSKPTKVGEQSYIFGKNVRVRRDSSLNSDVVATLGEGAPIHVLSKTISYSYQILGHGEPWLKIKTKTGKIGFVYGALIVKNYLTYDLNGNGIEELILLGNDFSNPPNAAIKVFEAGKLIISKKIESVCIDTHCETLVLLRIIKDKNLSNKDIIEVGTGTNFCREFWESTYLTYQNDDLELLFSEKMGYAGYTRVLFPSDKDGIKNHLIVERSIHSRYTSKKICEITRRFQLVDEEIINMGMESDLKENLVRLTLEVGDTLNTHLFYENLKNNKLISSSQLEKILSAKGLFIIDETKNTILLGDLLDKGENIELNFIALNKKDYSIKKEQKAAKELAWEHGYADMFSIYKGELQFETIAKNASRDFGDYSEWKIDTTITNFQIK